MIDHSNQQIVEHFKSLKIFLQYEILIICLPYNNVIV